ncbi:MAG: T9SS type A sorting domain-containing protein [Chitinophagales bacterium]|nr:T9SS type A sorting domain-containing protein [Chitinophagales bacterium]
MKKTITLMSAMAFSLFTFAQDLDFKWGGLFQTTGVNPPSINDIDRDSSGNYYVVGTIYNGDTVDVDIKAGVTQLSTTSNLAAFLAKYTTSGNLVWAKLIEGNSAVFAKSVIVRPSQDVLLGGEYAGTADFDPGVADQLATSNAYDWFILRLNPAGQYVTHVTTAKAGNQFFKKFRQDKNALYYSVRDESGGTNVAAELVFKSSANSNWQYYISVQGNSVMTANDFAVDTAGNVYVVGYYRGQIYYNPANSSQIILTASNYTQPFLVKINASGGFVFYQNLGCDGPSAGVAVTTDEAGNAYFGGYIKNTSPTNFGNGFTFSSPNAENTFLVKYNPAGQAQWLKRLAGKGISTAQFIDIDKKDNIYVSGYYKDTVDFNPDTIITNNLVSSSRYSPFILKLTKGGQFSGVADLKSKGDGFFNNLKIINDEVLSVGRSSTDTVDLNMGAAVSTFTTDFVGQSTSPFVSKHAFATCSAAASATATGLTVNIADAASYEWVDCTTNQPLAAGTTQSIVLAQSTNAFVQIEKGFCSTQSACAQFTLGSVGINEAKGGFDFNLYPNRAHAIVTLEITEKASSVLITDMLGKVAFELVNPAERETINVANFAAGVYLVSVEAQGQRTVKRLIIQ